MYKITKKMFNRGQKALKRLSRAKDNCKNLKRGVKIRSRLDVCYYELVNSETELYVTMDGSSTFGEWLNNFVQFGFFRKKRDDEKDRHFGMARAGNQLFDSFIKKWISNGNSLSDLGKLYYVTVDGKSRGGCLALQFTHRISKFLSTKVTVNSFGSPEFYTHKLAKKYQKNPPFIYNRFVLERDFVTKLGVALDHWQTKLILMPTIKGKLDHLAYAESLKKMTQV